MLGHLVSYWAGAEAIWLASTPRLEAIWMERARIWSGTVLSLAMAA